MSPKQEDKKNSGPQNTQCATVVSGGGVFPLHACMPRRGHGDFVLLGDGLRRRLVHVLHADRVDSVPLVGRRVAFPEEDVAQVRAAVVAARLRVALVAAQADVALVAREEALVVGVPTAVLELAIGAVQRVRARAAREVPRLGEERAVLALAGRLGAALAQDAEFLGAEPLLPLLVAELERVSGPSEAVRKDVRGTRAQQARDRRQRARSCGGIVL